MPDVDFLIIGLRRSGTTFAADLVHNPPECKVSFEQYTQGADGIKMVCGFKKSIQRHNPKKVAIISRDIRDVICSLIEYHKVTGMGKNVIDSAIVRLKAEANDLCSVEGKVFRYEDLCENRCPLPSFLGYPINTDRKLLIAHINGSAPWRRRELEKHKKSPKASVARWKNEDTWKPYYDQFKFYNEHFGYE